MFKSPNSREIIRVLHAIGFSEVSQPGSHLKLQKLSEGHLIVVIVKHPAKDVPVGTFLSILRQAGISRQEFESLLRSL